MSALGAGHLEGPVTLPCACGGREPRRFVNKVNCLLTRLRVYENSSGLIAMVEVVFFASATFLFGAMIECSRSIDNNTTEQCRY